MTITTTTNRQEYNGNDTATQFDFDFKLLVANSELVVTLVETDGTETTLAVTTDYTITLDSALPSKGHIDYPVSGDPLATGERLILRRVVPVTQTIDFENQGAYNAEDLEIGLDKQCAINQQLVENIGRCYQIGVGSTQSNDADTLISTVAASASSAAASASTATTQAGLASGFASDASNSASAAAASAALIDFADFSALTEETTPASGDLLVLEKAAGGKRKVDIDNIGGGGGKVVGEVFWFAGSSVPEDCLECDGAAISRTTYADLFTAIGTTWGSGDGSTTFNIPSAKTAGRFLRSRTSSVAVGTAQDAAFLNHSHTGSSNTTGAHTHTLTNCALAGGGATYVSPGGYTGVNLFATTSNGDHSHTITVDTSTTGGTETRPTNLSMILCIKF